MASRTRFNTQDRSSLMFVALLIPFMCLAAGGVAYYQYRIDHAGKRADRESYFLLNPKLVSFSFFR